MAAAEQHYGNHRRFSPLHHFIVVPCLLLNFGWAIHRVIRTPNPDEAINLVLAVALVLLAVVARVSALRVQDRVIRLEMRLRLKELLPPDLQPRIGEFTIRQLIAMRFASDRELPALGAVVLRDRIAGAGAIKKMVKEWQPDEFRV